jgi:hypothetical protein
MEEAWEASLQPLRDARSCWFPTDDTQTSGKSYYPHPPCFTPTIDLPGKLARENVSLFCAGRLNSHGTVYNGESRACCRLHSNRNAKR